MSIEIVRNSSQSQRLIGALQSLQPVFPGIRLSNQRLAQYFLYSGLAVMPLNDAVAETQHKVMSNDARLM
jgi:hypothetical protein